MAAVFQVNAHQWGKLQGREDVRLVDRDRASRTIIASYKNAHSTFCEFVADEEESKAVAAGTLPMLSQPPRFFTPREVARLQVRHARLHAVCCPWAALLTRLRWSALCCAGLSGGLRAGVGGAAEPEPAVPPARECGVPRDGGAHRQGRAADGRAGLGCAHERS